MQTNKYQERIIDIGRTKSAKLILPEKNDPRVSLAKRQLIDLGYNLLEPEDFRSRESHYAENLEKERFFKIMSDEAKKNKQIGDFLFFSGLVVLCVSALIITLTLRFFIQFIIFKGFSIYTPDSTHFESNHHF